MTYLKIIAVLAVMITFPQINHGQDNVFTGSTDTNWDNPSNWSTGNIPAALVVQKITIDADCIVPNTNNINYEFMAGSVLQINTGASFTNNGIGTWTMQGTIINNGTYLQTNLNSQGVLTEVGTFSGSLTANGTISPGNSLSTWTCGDPLIYGGQSYSTVQIGTQCWMAENLNLGTMLDGNLEVHDNGVIEKYCYNNDPANCDQYGGLYSWIEVMGYPSLPNIPTAQGLCPTGWHIPSDEEWMQLEGAVDSQFNYPDPEWEKLAFRGSDVSLKLKSSTNDWINNGSGTDDFGFAALPAGYRDHDASGADFFQKGQIAFFWSSTLYFPFLAYAKERQLWGLFDTTYRGNEVAGLGYSIRCVKD